MSVAIGEITYTLVMYNQLSDFTSLPKSLHTHTSNTQMCRWFTLVYCRMFIARCQVAFITCESRGGVLKRGTCTCVHVSIGLDAERLIGFLAKTICSIALFPGSPHVNIVFGENLVFFFCHVSMTYLAGMARIFNNKMATFCMLFIQLHTQGLVYVVIIPC